ncbi:MAG: hypothetical protein ACOH1K_00825 [Rhodoglobus sp.]
MMLTERTRTQVIGVDTGIPLVGWPECGDDILDELDSGAEGECTEHYGCASIF